MLEERKTQTLQRSRINLPSPSKSDSEKNKRDTLSVGVMDNLGALATLEKASLAIRANKS